MRLTPAVHVVGDSALEYTLDDFHSAPEDALPALSVANMGSVVKR